jgi:hypothetical protein
MASFAEKFASGVYTVNTAHAKCPDHLYLIDEASGSTLTDRGKTGGLNLTITNATWGTDDLTAGGGTSPILTFDGTGDYARSATNLTLAGGGTTLGNVLIVAIFKTTNATPPSGNQHIVALGKNDNSTDFIVLRGRITDGYLTGVYDDSAIAAASRANSASIYDQAWHMGAARIVETTSTNIQAGISLDGSAWATTSYTITADAALWNMNRICIGDSAGSSLGNEFNGKIAAVFIYKDVANPTTAWDNTFISELYADPWQFLATSVKKIKMLVHSSAQSDVDIAGVVFEAPSGGNITGPKIGEFTGAAFESSLEGGAAVLKVAVTEFGGAALTTSDTPVAMIKNASYQTGVVSCTVIEE